MDTFIESHAAEEAYLFNHGEHFYSYLFMGCHYIEKEDSSGYRFTVWAPHAKSVAVVGDFCDWDKGIELSKLGETGIWIAFSESAKDGDYYKFRIEKQNGEVAYKIDPYGFQFELRPKDATVIKKLTERKWKDSLYRARRKKTPIYQRPLNIYEVHAGSWMRNEAGDFLHFSELSQKLIPYVKSLGYTHIEFMPLMEHPLDESWGYQITGFYAISARYGTLDEFRAFVDACHKENIGVIMDWAPSHFCRNDYGLAYFDGTPQFEYHDDHRAVNRGWGTLHFDLGNPGVQSFLISNAMFWLDYCHLDGLRVDAVSSMLYLDYDGSDWVPNEDGSNHNRDAVNFIQKLNTILFKAHPDVLMIAEESSAWGGVTAPVHMGGLGFNYKWNMGWMNDILRFFEMDPIYRKYHFNLVTFSFIYMYDEQFILPLSHDEVVHGKKSLMHKMPGDRYNQFANLRVLLAYMMTHPGKQLLFMGSEWGQFLEWKVGNALEWVDLEDSLNNKMQHYTRTLNHLYLTHRALWEQDHQNSGIQILEADNQEDTILVFIRKAKKPKDFVIVICNFQPVQHEHFRVGVPFKGVYKEILNTELATFGGTWTTGQGDFKTTTAEKHGQPFHIEIILPAMSVVIIEPKRIIR